MNPFFYAFISLLLFTQLPVRAQFSRSVMADLWLFDCHPEVQISGSNAFRLALWQPLGVSNLVFMDVEAGFRYQNSMLTAGYSFHGLPGFCSHTLFSRFGLPLRDGLIVYQELGFGLHSALKASRVSWLLHPAHLIHLRVGSGMLLMARAENWLSLIWPESPHLSPAGLTVCCFQEIDEMTRLFCSVSVGASGEMSFFTGAAFKPADHHELFLSFCLAPMSMSLGYAFPMRDVQIKLLFESSPISGFTPYTMLQWKR